MYISAINNYNIKSNLYKQNRAKTNAYKPAENTFADTVSFSAKYKTLTKKELEQISDMRVFNHHVYELKKGVRNLILTTEKSKYKDYMEERLQKEGIDYVMQSHRKNNLVNVFFGKKACVDVVKTMDYGNLTPEQDFILGTMLGYDRIEQCKRYLDFRSRLIEKK